ncbi:hypothetical protein GCM10028804_01500 [Larkinella terrae]
MQQRMNFRKLTMCVYTLLTACSAFAQTDAYYQSYHWQLHTDAVSQQTVVAFYDNHNRIIYQETLPGKHIRLTRKNVRRLDQTSRLLANKQLVTSTIQPDRILAQAPDSQMLEVPERFSLLGTAVPDSAFAGFRATVVPTPGDRIALYYTQPDENLVSIMLLDPTGNAVYQEIISHLKYKRYLDLGNLGYGEFRLILSNSQYRYSYRLGVHYPNAKNRPVLLSAYAEPVQPTPGKPISEPLNVFLDQQRPDPQQRGQRLGKENLFISSNRSVNTGNSHAGQKE